MSFKDLEEEDLRKLAVEDFGVSVEPDAKVEEICAALVEDGVTWEMAVAQSSVAAAVQAKLAVEQAEAKSVPVNKPAPAEGDEQPDALLRMMRENSRYDIRGYTFTHENPFGLVDANNAEWIVENVEGFRYATPKEAREFYS